MSRVEHILILLQQSGYDVEEGVNEAVQIVHSFFITIFHIPFSSPSTRRGRHSPSCLCLGGIFAKRKAMKSLWLELMKKYYVRPCRLMGKALEL